MQLIILGSKHTSKDHFREGNAGLELTSTKLRKAASQAMQNPSFKEVSTIKLETPYHKTKQSVDDEVMGYLQDQLTAELRKVKKDKSLHETLHIYSHGSTFGLGFKEKKEQGVKLLPDKLAALLVDYLVEHPECTRIKLHVCFTGMDYGRARESYGEQFKAALQALQIAGQIPQTEITIEAVKGMSILGKGTKDTRLYSHFALPADEKLETKIEKSKDTQKIIDEQALKKDETPKPRFIAKK